MQDKEQISDEEGVIEFTDLKQGSTRIELTEEVKHRSTERMC